jgi:hypothetical protein
VDGTHFIGTTDNIPLNFRVNNQKAGRIDLANDNIFFGYQSGNSGTGNANIGIGNQVLFSNTSGNNNIANGYQALYTNTTGSNNIAIGSGTLALNINGNGNIAIGSGALTGIYGSTNTIAIGLNAGGSNNFNHTDNTFIGAGSGTIVTNITNATAIGSGAIVQSSNAVRIGNTSVSEIRGQVPFSSSSDRRLKTEIKTLDEGLSFIQKLKPVSYLLKNGDKRTNWGFIAQDIESLVGQGNNVLSIGGDSSRTLGLRYTDFVAPLTKAVQELAIQNENQSESIRALEAKVQERDNKIAILEANLKTATKNEAELKTLKAEIEKIKTALRLDVNASVGKAKE